MILMSALRRFEAAASSPILPDEAGGAGMDTALAALVAGDVDVAAGAVGFFATGGTAFFGVLVECVEDAGANCAVVVVDSRPDSARAGTANPGTTASVEVAVGVAVRGCGAGAVVTYARTNTAMRKAMMVLR